MSPGVDQLEATQVSVVTVKRISDKERIESVCHVGRGSPPKPTPLRYIKPRRPSSDDAGPIELIVPTDYSRHSDASRSEKAKTKTNAPKPSPARRQRKLSNTKTDKCSIISPSHTQHLSPTHSISSSGAHSHLPVNSHGHSLGNSRGQSPNLSRGLLKPERRRATVGTCSAERSPFIRARQAVNRRKLSKAQDQYSRTSSNSNNSLPNSESQELNEYHFDPVKVTNLDIDAGSYFPDPSHLDFLRMALSESPNPFAKENIRERAVSVGNISK